MTDLSMLKHLLNKTGQVYYEFTFKNGKHIVQLPVSNIMHQWEFDVNEELTEVWDNKCYNSYICSPFFEDYLEDPCEDD